MGILKECDILMDMLTHRQVVGYLSLKLFHNFLMHPEPPAQDMAPPTETRDPATINSNQYSHSATG